MFLLEKISGELRTKLSTAVDNPRGSQPTIPPYCKVMIGRGRGKERG